MFKIFQNHEAAQAFPKCQKISNIGIFPKVTKKFWAEMKEETFNLDNFPWQTKISKNCPKIQNCFSGGAFLEKNSPKSVQQFLTLNVGF
jgi:phage terminase large subunit-like protein